MSLLNRMRSIGTGAKATGQPAATVAELLGIQAKVGSTPTYDLAHSERHDIAVMLECCDAEEANYWRQPAGDRLCAAPHYFERVAILCRKAKDYPAEIAICERWKAIAKDYGAQPMVKAGRAAKVHRGPRSVAILDRVKKARALKAKAAGRS